MKNFLLVCSILIGSLQTLQAQAPQAMNYQGIARNLDGKALANQAMHLRISIIDGAQNGTIIYTETHDVRTNQFGLYTLKIGEGTVTVGTFKDIQWNTFNKYVHVENLENNVYTDLGTTQLLSVPYALYAETAGKSLSGGAKATRGGTSNYLSKFDATGSSSAEVNSQMWDNGTSIGVNTTAPQAKMHVFQNAPSSNILVMESQDSTGFGRFSLWNDKGFANRATFTRYGSKNTTSQPGSTLFPNADLLAFGCNKGSFLISTAGDAGIQVVNAGLVKLRLMVEDSTGNVGIGGNAFPQNTLHINSETTNDSVRITNATTGNTKNDGLLIGNNGNAAFMTNRENSTLSIGTNNATQITLDALGNMGVGTVTPGAKLDVAGQVKISGGAPGAGKVLTSDAAGLATWQTPSGGGGGAVSSVNGATGAVTNSITLGSAGTTPAITGSGSNTVTLNLPTASATNTGVLSAANWTMFNNKLGSSGGTLNYVPKYTPNGTTLGNSQIIDNGSFVGIGTNAPAVRLDVQTNDWYNTRFKNTGTGTDKSSLIGIENGNAVSSLWLQGVSGNGNGWPTLPNGSFYLENYGKPLRMIVDSNGNFGFNSNPKKMVSANIFAKMTVIPDTNLLSFNIANYVPRLVNSVGYWADHGSAGNTTLSNYGLVYTNEKDSTGYSSGVFVSDVSALSTGIYIDNLGVGVESFARKGNDFYAAGNGYTTINAIANTGYALRAQSDSASAGYFIVTDDTRPHDNGVLVGEYKAAIPNAITDHIGVLGKSQFGDKVSYGIGVQGEGGYYGIKGKTDSAGSAGVIGEGLGDAAGAGLSSQSGTGVYASSTTGAAIDAYNNSNIAPTIKVLNSGTSDAINIVSNAVGASAAAINMYSPSGLCIKASSSDFDAAYFSAFNNYDAVSAQAYGKGSGVEAYASKGNAIKALTVDSTLPAGYFYTNNTTLRDYTNGILVGEYLGTDSSSADHIGVYGRSLYNNKNAWGIGIKGEGGYRGVEAVSRNSAVSSSSTGLHALAIRPASSNGIAYGVNSTASTTSGSSGYGIYGTATGAGVNFGVYGIASGVGNYAGYFSGTLYATTVTGGTKPFTLDHPLDPANKILRHSSIESPDMMNIYNGNITTDANGDCIVIMPDYFEALNGDFKYQLTVIGTFAQAIIGSEIKDNQFTIKTNQPNVKVSWQVTGVRHDAVANKYRIVVEENKTEAQRGQYFEPEAYGQPASKRYGYAAPDGKPSNEESDLQATQERKIALQKEYTEKQKNMLTASQNNATNAEQSKPKMHPQTNTIQPQEGVRSQTAAEQIKAKQEENKTKYKKILNQQ
jgi:hypothetical protein